ncbi:hypothetical protein [Clostridium sp. OS1-26]|uniref:hypothetical protein n=1 Tax=Clostridium sp. OS1-26 TaxID=3070681 RepID=UPI0027DED7C4|nr:hypothetical protein [Clostridium sp. OS1-26]WML35354.1 hypothetical protein RCG18_00905 [Clostridium sp. OS1-26]
MIKLSKEQHNYVISILDKNNILKDRILKVSSLINNDYEYDMDDELEIDFYDFLQDKQVEIGFDKDYKPNEEWEKIQILIDEVYNQTN